MYLCVFHRLIRYTFFRVASHWILLHAACVSELPGSRTLFDVIFPKIFNSAWRGISFNNALQTYGDSQVSVKVTGEQDLINLLLFTRIIIGRVSVLCFIPATTPVVSFIFYILAKLFMLQPLLGLKQHFSSLDCLAHSSAHLLGLEVVRQQLFPLQLVLLYQINNLRLVAAVLDLLHHLQVGQHSSNLFRVLFVRVSSLDIFPTPCHVFADQGSSWRHKRFGLDDCLTLIRSRGVILNRGVSVVSFCLSKNTVKVMQ